MPLDGKTILNKIGKGTANNSRARGQRPEPEAAAAPPVIEATYQTPFPDDPTADAYHGLAGDLVRTIDAHTEASRVAVLVQTLAAYGNVIGTAPHFRVENTRHCLNLFCVIVGQTAKGRKGTSWNRVLQIFEAVDATWVKERICSGMSSGEGLIWEVRDPVYKEERQKESTGEVHFETIQVAQGIADKRLMVQEAEFAIGAEARGPFRQHSVGRHSPGVGVRQYQVHEQEQPRPLHGSAHQHRRAHHGRGAAPLFKLD